MSWNVVISGYTNPASANQEYTELAPANWRYDGTPEDYYLNYDTDHWSIQEWTAKGGYVQIGYLTTDNNVNPEGTYTLDDGRTGTPIVEWYVGAAADPTSANLVFCVNHNDNKPNSRVLESAKLNHGTLYDSGGEANTEDYDASGAINGAIDYDGSAMNAEFAHTSDYVFGTSFSVIAVINPDTLTSNAGIISKFETTTPAREWTLYAYDCSDSTARIRMHFGDSDGLPLDGYYTELRLISTGSYQMIGFTFDGSEDERDTCSIYYNGKRYAARWINHTPPDTINSETSIPIKIGCRTDEEAELFDGKIDIVAIYDDVLSAEEMLWFYNSGSFREDRIPPYLLVDTEESVGATDTATAEEETGGETTLEVNVSESVGVTDTVAAVIPVLHVSVTESVGVTDEAAAIVPELFISVTESVGVGDIVTPSLNPLLVDVTESVGVTDEVDVAVEGAGVLEVNVAESVGVSDSVSALIPELFVEAIESVGVDDTLDVKLNPLLVNVTEQVGVTDEASAQVIGEGVLEVSVSESIGVLDSVSAFVNPLNVSVAESVGVRDLTVLPTNQIQNGTFDDDSAWTKDAQWSISGGVATYTADGSWRYINQDCLPALEIGKWYKFTYEITANSLSGGDPRLALSSASIFGANYVSIDIGTHDYYFEATNTGHSYDLRIGAVADSGTLVIDNVEIYEATAVNTVQVSLNPLFVSVTESVGVSDEVSAQVIGEGVLEVSVSESIGVTDTVSAFVNPLNVSVAESIGVNDTVIASLNPLLVSVTELLGVTDTASASRITAGAFVPALWLAMKKAKQR